MTPAATVAGRAAAKRQEPDGASSRSPSGSAPPKVPALPNARRAPAQTPTQRSATARHASTTSPRQAGAGSGERDAQRRVRSRTPRTSKLTPRIPRRISGPAGGVDAALRMPSAARGDGAAIRLPRIGPGSPIRLPHRRRPGQPPRARRRRLRIALGAIALEHLLVATIALVRAAPDHRWLDRLVRSRWWIPVLGVMLTAIVAMQVEVLKYGAGTGRALNLATRLESRNQLLSASVASLDSPQRIEQAAAQMGMVMAGPTSVQFVNASAPAIAHIESPNSESFMTALATVDGTGSGSATGGSTATAAGLAAAATAAVSAGAAATTGAATLAAAPASSTAGATPAAPLAGANVGATSGASSGATPAASLAGANVGTSSGASSGATPAASLAGANASATSGASSGAAALPTGD